MEHDTEFDQFFWSVRNDWARMVNELTPNQSRLETRDLRVDPANGICRYLF